MVDPETAAKGATGMAAIGAAIYGAWRMLRNDTRGDKNADTLDSATHQIIETLREEVGRLAARLETVELAHNKCREENAEIKQELAALRMQLKVTA